MAGSLDDTLVACFGTWFVPRPGIGIFWMVHLAFEMVQLAFSIKRLDNQ